MLSLAQKLVAVGVLASLNVAIFLFSPLFGILGLFLIGPLSLLLLVDIVNM